MIGSALPLATRRRFLKTAAAMTLAGLTVSTARAQQSQTLSMAAFQEEALEILRRHFANEGFEKGKTETEIISKRHHLYLDMIYPRAREMTAPEREKAVVAWFATLDAAAREADQIWGDFSRAKPLLRPRLWPRTGVALETLARRPFVADLYSVYVVDQPTTATFITQDRLAAWGVDVDTLHKHALTNLEEATRNIPIAAFGGKDDKNEWAMVAANDSYDAARILLPSVRRNIASILGPVALAAVPRRDIFIAWTKGHSPRPEDLARLAGDAWAAPPLSGAILRLANGEVRVATHDDIY